MFKDKKAYCYSCFTRMNRVVELIIRNTEGTLVGCPRCRRQNGLFPLFAVDMGYIKRCIKSRIYRAKQLEREVKKLEEAPRNEKTAEEIENIQWLP